MASLLFKMGEGATRLERERERERWIKSTKCVRNLRSELNTKPKGLRVSEN